MCIFQVVEKYYRQFIHITDNSFIWKFTNSVTSNETSNSIVAGGAQWSQIFQISKRALIHYVMVFLGFLEPPNPLSRDWSPKFATGLKCLNRHMCFSCHIRHLTKCPNWCRTWNICFLLIFSWKMLQPNFAF